ncbi:hypothetical protein TorRG33x02_190550 [Trema orientale]|uniref:Uncharacterized protein n=1 Tax=Trema orientale TaxID=63057 RepID=A0A2P5EI26_TREOI|nr:hypothetical protein TorRG33x02_190550 [Trema orientale]
MTDFDIAEFWSQTSIYRLGIDVTKAELIRRTNWRWQESIFLFGSRKVANGDAGMVGSEFEKLRKMDLLLNWSFLLECYSFALGFIPCRLEAQLSVKWYYIWRVD